MAVDPREVVGANPAHREQNLFDRLGRYEPAATIAGFALLPFSAAAVREITTAIAHLRDVLGDQTHPSLACKN